MSSSLSPSTATTVMLPFAYPPANKPSASLTHMEKLIKIGRNMPCDQSSCECLGWRPRPANTGAGGRADLCACGHKLSFHGGNQDDMDRRLRAAIRIDELLEVCSVCNSYKG